MFRTHSCRRPAWCREAPVHLKLYGSNISVRSAAHLGNSGSQVKPDAPVLQRRFIGGCASLIQLLYQQTLRQLHQLHFFSPCGGILWPRPSVSPPPMTTICSWGKNSVIICSTSSRLWKPYTPPACPSPSTGGRLVREPVAIKPVIPNPDTSGNDYLRASASVRCSSSLYTISPCTLPQNPGSAKQIPSLSLIPPR